ncbi:hypothetical protein Ga0466249_001522 [Sporomusaceae bacterium BoRhaA]|uniref:VgrG-related protein n=1 Tax=Pelorhabdus rhamnosifermentans TaxID=2772457 RepID=UPI001C062EE0|nr:hypothetical protein [Pelorhabdus rhamnosifermentans]MBU2700430.1 hypothetical protein [Pelorhabdus rhamnosifermentans]
MLGDLSKQYESNGDPACVSSGCGDLGGQSYGMYQFSSIDGVVDAFVQWTKQQAEPLNNYGVVLEESGAVNSAEFIAKWQELGTIDPIGFGQLQHDYIKAVYYDEAVQNLIDNLGIDVNNHSEALQQVLWSRAVQYSAGNMVELFNDACNIAGQNISNISDYDLIYNIYEFLIQDGNQAYQTDNGLWHSPNDWLNGSHDIINSLINRFYNERVEALAML